MSINSPLSFGYLLNIQLENEVCFVMIGDRSHDIVETRTIQVDSVGVLYGYGSAKEPESAQPTHIVSSVSELAALLSGK